jgi:hypothetical protein
MSRQKQGQVNISTLYIGKVYIMPRLDSTTPKNRYKDLDDWEDGTVHIANAVFRGLTFGAYVGVYHNYSTGVNFSVMWEDNKQKFHASNLWELSRVADEIEEWIHELQHDKKATKKTRHVKS